MTGIARRNLALLSCMLVGLIVLCWLGTWQVTRLYWKEALLERIETRIAQEPVPLIEVMQFGFNQAQQDYLPVSFDCEFDHSTESYFFTTGQRGEPGWNVHTVAKLSGGKTVIVNRGFVPFDNKLPGTRAEGQVAGQQHLIGLLRFPLSEKPLGSLDNNLDAREFYWRSLPDFEQAMQLDNKPLPVIVDLQKNDIPGGLPMGGTTLLSFPNNHLQYAVTWFGLALTLLGVGGYFVLSREKSQR